MKFCTDAYFYEMLCLKINWNLDRAPLTQEKIRRGFILKLTEITYRFLYEKVLGVFKIALRLRDRYIFT